jgi:hypothetical protein
VGAISVVDDKETAAEATPKRESIRGVNHGGSPGS